MPKQNKIIAIVCADDQERRRMLQRMAVKLGLATTPGDAAKLIRPTPYDYDLQETYFVLAGTCNLGESPLTTQQLFRMSVQGMAVVVGMKRLKPEYEFLCETYYQGQL